MSERRDSGQDLKDLSTIAGSIRSRSDKMLAGIIFEAFQDIFEFFNTSIIVDLDRLLPLIEEHKKSGGVPIQDLLQLMKDKLFDVNRDEYYKSMLDSLIHKFDEIQEEIDDIREVIRNDNL